MIKQAVLTMVAVQAAQAGVKYMMSGQSPFSSSSSPAAQSVIPSTPDSAEFAKVSTSPDLAAAPAAAVAGKPAQAQAVLPVLEPLWAQGTVFDAHMYITATGYPHVDLDNPRFPSVKFEGLTFGDWTWKHEWDTQVRLPPVRLRFPLVQKKPS